MSWAGPSQGQAVKGAEVNYIVILTHGELELLVRTSIIFELLRITNLWENVKMSWEISKNFAQTVHSTYSSKASSKHFVTYLNSANDIRMYHS
jgi:hypothetical protein